MHAAVKASQQLTYIWEQVDESVAEEEELFAVGVGAADGTPARGQGSAAAAADGLLGPKITSPAADPEASLLSDNEQADALLDVSPAIANGTSTGAKTWPAGGIADFSTGPASVLPSACQWLHKSMCDAIPVLAAAVNVRPPLPDPMGDLLGLGDPVAPAAPPPPAAAAPPPPPRMQLQPSPHLSPAQFQQLWEALPPAATFQAPLQPSAVSATQTNHLVR